MRFFCDKHEIILKNRIIDNKLTFYNKHNKMKDSKKGFAFFIFCATGFFIVIGTGCRKEKAILPEVSTIEVTVVTPISASCSGQVNFCRQYKAN